MNDTQQPFLPIYVRQDKYHQALRLVATLETEAEESDEPFEWTDEILADALADLSPSMRTFIRDIAKHSPEWRSLVNIAEGMGESWKAVSGHLGAYTQRQKKRLSKGRWPFKWTEMGGTSWYRVEDPEGAKRMLQLLDS